MTIPAPNFCAQQTVTLNDTNPSKYLSRLGNVQPVTIWYNFKMFKLKRWNVNLPSAVYFSERFVWDLYVNGHTISLK